MSDRLRGHGAVSPRTNTAAPAGRPSADPDPAGALARAAAARRIAPADGDAPPLPPLDRSPLDLRGFHAGRAGLAAQAEAVPPDWWDAARQRVTLAGTDLDGALLEEADLGGADLSRARLAGARARSSRWEGAVLEATDLSGADLGGARFAGIVAGQAKFAGAMLEDVDFAGAAMRFAVLAEASLDGATFDRADLWGADLRGADADHTHFRGARLDEADLSDVNLTYADFTGASLKRTRLVGSRLRGAKLRDARLDGTDLSRADLAETDLVRLNLATCRLEHARFAGAWLNGTRMRVEQLGGMVGEEVAGEFEAARASYLALEQNFKSIGGHDAASWAYKRGRRMGRQHAGALARAALAGRAWGGVMHHGYRWAADRFVEWLCDYGESLSRIVRAFGLVIVLFAVGFGLTGGLLVDETPRVPTYNPIDLLSYSALNMLTANPPEIGIKPIGRITNLLVGVEGAVGIILMGLFGFVLGNRLRR